jgi:hypothetical protein
MGILPGDVASSIVQIIVNVIEPEHGTVFDPACGSGGMFVQSSHFHQVAIALARMSRTLRVSVHQSGAVASCATAHRLGWWPFIDSEATRPW